MTDAIRLADAADPAGVAQTAQLPGAAGPLGGAEPPGAAGPLGGAEPPGAARPSGRDDDPGSVPVITFVAPMPGFPDDHRFVLVEVDGSGLLYSLRSLDSPALRFLVTPSAPFFPEYAPEIDDETLAALGTSDPADLLVLLVVRAGDAPREATANLMAPVVVDQRHRRGVQLVLSGSGLPVRAPLLVTRAPAGGGDEG